MRELFSNQQMGLEIQKNFGLLMLMEEGFILLTRGYLWGGGVPHPFDKLKIGTFTDDLKLKLYR